MPYHDATMSTEELKKAYSFLMWKKLKKKFTESDKMELDTIHHLIKVREGYHS